MSDVAKRFGSQCLETSIYFIFPANCHACESPITLEPIRYFCSNCWNKIEFVGDSPNSCSFSSCRKIRSIVEYKPTINRAIGVLKQYKKRVMATYLIELMVNNLPIDLSADDYDFLIPIPLHRKRQKDRGFNQSKLLAKGIAKQWKIPMRNNLISRPKETKKLSRLKSPQERIEMMKDAFKLKSMAVVANLRLLLIDDIFTTGTTSNHAAELLLSAGAKYVDLLTLARA